LLIISARSGADKWKVQYLSFESQDLFQNEGAVGGFMDQAGRRGPVQAVLVARARRHAAIQRRVEGRIRACRSF
jgi:hypothetical protein